MDGSLVLLIAVMIAAGALGGTINYFLTRRTEPDDSSIAKSLIVGIGASFLVPLFLNMISSNLIDSIRGTSTTPGDLSKALVFAGFCLVAAISSTAFIRTLSDRILSEAKAARKEAEEAKEEVLQVQATIDPLLEKETEGDMVEKVGLPTVRNEIDEDERRILLALRDSQYTLRSLNGITSETGMPRDKLEDKLSNLSEKSLVGLRADKKGDRWYITRKGMEAISGLRPTPPLERTAEAAAQRQ